MPFKDPITYDSIPTVQRARNILAGLDPNEAVRYLVDAAVALARRNGTTTDPQFACADAIVDVTTETGHEPVSEVLLPEYLPVAIIAELGLAVARDAVHFLRKLEYYPGAAVQGADKYLRGLLHASTLLTALVTNATVPGLSARLFGRDMTRQQMMDELDIRSMRRVLFQMVEREDSRRERREPEELDEEGVLKYLLRAFAAALLDRRRDEGTLAAVLSTYQRIDDTFDEIFRDIAEVLRRDYQALTDITRTAFLDLKRLAGATFHSGDIDEALLLVECTEPLRILADECGVLDASLHDTLYELLRQAGTENARELAGYLSLGAFLGTVQRKLDALEYDESLMAGAVATFGTSPHFWDAARQRCEREGFAQAGQILDTLRRSACVQADSPLAIYARELCAPLFPNQRTSDVLLRFVNALKALTKERAASRYPESLDDSLPEEQIDEQRAAIVIELHQALPARLRPIFLQRLSQCVELGNMSPRDEILLLQVYSLLEEHVEDRAHARTGPELHM